MRSKPLDFPLRTSETSACTDSAKTSSDLGNCLDSSARACTNPGQRSRISDGPASAVFWEYPASKAATRKTLPSWIISLANFRCWSVGLREYPDIEVSALTLSVCGVSVSSMLESMRQGNATINHGIHCGIQSIANTIAISIMHRIYHSIGTCISRKHASVTCYRGRITPAGVNYSYRAIHLTQK